MQQSANIICDECGEDCYIESYLMQPGDADLCPDCFMLKGSNYESAVRQASPFARDPSPLRPRAAASEPQCLHSLAFSSPARSDPVCTLALLIELLRCRLCRVQVQPACPGCVSHWRVRLCRRRARRWKPMSRSPSPR